MSCEVIFLNLDINNIQKQGCWFSADVKYEGQGRAIFSDPLLAVEGYVEIEFDEFGNQTISMEVERIDTSLSSEIPNIPPEFKKMALMALLSGEKPEERPVDGTKMSQWRWPIGGTKASPCKSLKVVTSDGIFLANRSIGYNIHIGFSRVNGSSARLEFHILSSVFRVDRAFEAKYWVLPLMNFISDFQDSLPELDLHPLRLYPWLKDPRDTADEHEALAGTRTDQDNRLIIFRFRNKLGFIERFNDYDERKRKLLEGHKQSIITSLMVGEIYSNKINFEDLGAWFPFQFLDLLGLASGTEIGAPWIEFRDTRGGLVQRFHLNLNNPWFSSGHATIDERIHRSTGYLLTQSQYSLHFGNAYLTAVLKHLVRSGMKSLLFEDRMAHLFQGLDCLCEEFGLNIQRLADSLNDSQREYYKNEIKALAERIRSQSSVLSDTNQRNALEKIASRIANADNTDRDFGLAVVDLLRLFDLPDAIVVDSHYRKNPRRDGKSWWGVLSHYRGIVMHSSYFDFERGTYDFQEVALYLNLIENSLRHSSVRYSFQYCSCRNDLAAYPIAASPL